MELKKLLDTMTLEEKCALLSGRETFKTRALPQYEIPQMWLSDGPHGVRKQAGESDHLGLNPSVPATCFPPAAAIANSWDPELGEEIGQALGEEAAAQDVAVLLGPGLNIKRNPLCGRNFEYFSEDPYLSGKMAAGYIRGIQSRGIAACPKHFAVNNQELRRMVSNSVVDERTLREIYLTGFEIAVKEGGPETIMSAYNLVNGEYANENEHLLKDILRGEWGFDGAVITDWGGSDDHANGVKCGSTLEMPAPGGDSVRELMAAVQSGKVTEEDIDARLRELLPLIFKTHEALENAPKTFDKQAHHALARKAAAESIVLLKNEGNILPLKKGVELAVIGDFAAQPRYQGAGSSMVNSLQVDTLLDVFQKQNIPIADYATGFERHGQPNEKLKKDAVELARETDVVLLCLGLDEIQESEGMDRPAMRLAQNQVELLKAVAAVNPHIVVLFSSGSSVEMPWLEQCQALVYGSLGGQAGAGAVVDVLTGKVCPGGKLVETWPLRYEDAPSRKNFGTAGRNVQYREGLYVGYRYYQTAQVPVLFPFGYGLSYTSFQYSDLSVEENCVTLTVTNTGKRAGSETVQLYVSKPDAVVFRPKQELKGFAKVWLQPGEQKKVTLRLDDKAFRYWNTKTNHWEQEEGNYLLRVGSSSEDIRLETVISVVGTALPDPYMTLDLPHYRSGQVQEVSTAEFEALLGHPLPEDTVKIDRNMTLGEMNHSRSPLGWLVQKVLSARLDASIQKGKPDLNTMFQYNMPLRALAKMTNGMVSMGMVDGVVMELRGFWVIGILRVVYEFFRNMLLNHRMEKRLSEKGD